jgi:Na+/citrate or Na+/malate symporter
MNYIIPSAIAISGVIVGILIGVGKVEQQALLVVTPMISGGCFLWAVIYVRRRNSDSGNNHNT